MGRHVIIYVLLTWAMATPNTAVQYGSDGAVECISLIQLGGAQLTSPAMGRGRSASLSRSHRTRIAWGSSVHEKSLLRTHAADRKGPRQAVKRPVRNLLATVRERNAKSMQHPAAINVANGHENALDGDTRQIDYGPLSLSNLTSSTKWSKQSLIVSSICLVAAFAALLFCSRDLFCWDLGDKHSIVTAESRRDAVTLGARAYRNAVEGFWKEGNILTPELIVPPTDWRNEHLFFLETSVVQAPGQMRVFTQLPLPIADKSVESESPGNCLVASILAGLGGGPMISLVSPSGSILATCDPHPTERMLLVRTRGGAIFAHIRVSEGKVEIEARGGQRFLINAAGLSINATDIQRRLICTVNPPGRKSTLSMVKVAEGVDVGLLLFGLLAPSVLEHNANGALRTSDQRAPATLLGPQWPNWPRSD